MRQSMALACGALLHLLLLPCQHVLVQCQSEDSSDSTCSTFSADVLGSAGNQTFQDTFSCSDGAYVTGVNITYGWWIDALQIFCSTGNASDWYGDGESLEGVDQSFVDTGVGLTSMSSQFKLQEYHNFPCFLTFLVYTGEVEGSSSESEIGPFGSCGRFLTSPTSEWDTVSGEFSGTSDCGLDAYAIGFLVHYDDNYIYGLGLQCRNITTACPAPDGMAGAHTLAPTHESYTLQPTPETSYSSDSTCSTFSADVLGSAGSQTLQDTFICSDGAYVTGVNITYGWWIDALQIFCSTGNASDWYGDGESLEGVDLSFVDTLGGLTSVSSQFKLNEYHNFPCFLTFLAYTGEGEESSSESEIGPYGSCGRFLTSPTSEWDTVSGEFNGTSDCGLDAYAIGFLVHYDDNYIYGLGLQCRNITTACPAPDGMAGAHTLAPTHEPYTLQPTPESNYSSDSTCSTFSADVLGSAGSQTLQDTFICNDGAYVTGVNITYGWWIDALQIFCSTGNASDWYGDGESLEGVDLSFVDTLGGLTSVSSQFKLSEYHNFPCLLTFLAYTGEGGESSSESEIGPYGSCGRFLTSPTSEWDTVSGEFNGTSDCGLDAYAIGFLVHYDDNYIYGLGLQCRNITTACPAPDGMTEAHTLAPTHEPYTLQPTPESNYSSDSTCSTFLADMLGSAGNQTLQDTFNCNDGAYVTGVNITYGWWIDALQIFCSTGNASDWYGDGESLEGVDLSFVDTLGGLTSMSSQFKLSEYHNFPCFLTFLAYTGEGEESSSESEIGPYGSCGRFLTSPTSEWDTVSGEFNGTSDCGLDAYAIGFLVHYDDNYIYGLGLQCRKITEVCPAPDGMAVAHTLAPTQEPYTMPPTPASNYSSVR